jgi:hypothetical protein
MGKRSFFTFALGTAAVAAGVSLIKKKGGLHLSFDVAPSELGQTAAEWKARHEGERAAAEQEGNGEAETGEN